MQLQLVQCVIALTFLAYQTSSATVATPQLPADLNQTVTQALIASTENQTNLMEEEYWPIKDNYWLLISQSNLYMHLKYIFSVLKQAEKSLGKRQADQKITGVLSITADRASERYNEADFVFTAISGHEVTLGDALLAVTGLISWYEQEPASEMKLTAYFYLADQSEHGRGNYGYGAMKRVWQPFPPSLGGNVSVSR